MTSKSYTPLCWHLTIFISISFYGYYVLFNSLNNINIYSLTHYFIFIKDFFHFSSCTITARKNYLIFLTDESSWLWETVSWRGEYVFLLYGESMAGSLQWHQVSSAFLDTTTLTSSCEWSWLHVLSLYSEPIVGSFLTFVSSLDCGYHLK